MAVVPMRAQRMASIFYSPLALGTQLLETAEHRVKFVAGAEAVRKAMFESSKSYDGDTGYTYLRSRVFGKKSTRPKATG